MSELTTATVEGAFRSNLDESAAVARLIRGPVGNGQETWFVTLDDGREFVLRRSAAGGPLAWTDRSVEFAALRSLAAEGMPVPTVHWLGDGSEELGRPYFVMERMAGVSPHRLDDTTATALAEGMGRWLAELHTLTVDSVVFPDRAATAEESTQAEVARWEARYRRDRAAPVLLLSVLYAWLGANVPENRDRPAVVWGDAAPYNLLHEDGELTAMLDWELIHVGDPREDLGAAAWSCRGVLDVEVVLGAYEQQYGNPVDRSVVAYFEVMACVTRATMLVSAINAIARGEGSAPNLMGLGLQLVSANLLRAVRLLGMSVPEVPVLEGGRLDEHRLRPDGEEILLGITRFIEDDILPVVEDPRLRRGLKTIGPLLETVALRGRIDGPIGADLASRRRALTETFDASGIASRLDFEAKITAAATSSDAEIRELAWNYLLDELASTRRQVAPMIRLYEGGPPTSP